MRKSMGNAYVAVKATLAAAAAAAAAFKLQVKLFNSFCIMDLCVCIHM